MATPGWTLFRVPRVVGVRWVAGKGGPSVLGAFSGSQFERPLFEEELLGRSLKRSLTFIF